MNILIVTENHSTNNYGITSVVSQLVNEIVDHDKTMRVAIITTTKDPVPQYKSIPIEVVPPAWFGASWGWSPGLKERLDNMITRYHIDVVHIHGVWMAVQWAALTVARQRGIPCLVSPHGMFEPWLWNEQNPLKKYKKKIYFHLLFKNKITQSTSFHAITPIERDNLQRLFPKQSVDVIPNAIKLEENSYDNSAGVNMPKKKILFLGRLHPVKGLDLLIRAFFEAGLDDEWRLVIAGPAHVPQYAENLKSLVSKLNLSGRVEFKGPIFGDAKQNLMRMTWIMVVPSYSEVVGMVNLEAAACKVPSITTFETGLWDWEEGGGILVHPKVDELSDAITKASRWSIEERLLRGEKSHILAQEKYSWDAIISSWMKLYSDVSLGRSRNE